MSTSTLNINPVRPAFPCELDRTDALGLLIEENKQLKACIDEQRDELMGLLGAIDILKDQAVLLKSEREEWKSKYQALLRVTETESVI